MAANLQEAALFGYIVDLNLVAVQNAEISITNSTLNAVHSLVRSSKCVLVVR